MPSRATPDMFTRFTSTSPTAASKLSASRSSNSPSFQSSPLAKTASAGSQKRSSPAPSFPSPTNPSSPFPIPPAPPNETPQEKVARLRAASRRAKYQAATSPLDRTLDRGRRVADVVHRAFAYSLIGFAGVATCIAVYAGVDLVLHNRRQKRGWIDRELQRLHEAREAFVRGDPNPEQLHLLQQERAGEELAEKKQREGDRKRREGWWGRGLAIVGLGRGGGEAGGTSTKASPGHDQAGREVVDEDPARYGRVPGIRTPAQGNSSNSSNTTITTTSTDSVAAQQNKPLSTSLPSSTTTRGGPLDILASNLTGAGGSSGSSNDDKK